MLSFDPQIVVPGHGPVGGADGIRRVRDYLQFITDYADSAHSAGHGLREAADRVDLGEFSGWLDPERVVANIYVSYQEIEPSSPRLSVIELFTRQAEWLAARAARR